MGKAFKVVAAVWVVLILILLLVTLFLGGCATKPPARYVPGQLYGDGGATPCVDARGVPIACKVDGGVPWCPYPDDGDGF